MAWASSYGVAFTAATWSCIFEFCSRKDNPMWKLAFALLALVGVSLAVVASGERSSPAAGKKVLQAVVHVNFPDAARQGHGLKNIENILKAVKDARVQVVCHGMGISLLVKSKTKHAAKVESLMKHGVRFVACENTMRQKGLTPADLLAGVTTVPSGAVEVIRKQQEGYGYFKP